jgi:hypothetical protein
MQAKKTLQEHIFVSTYQIYLTIIVTFPEHKNTEIIIYICIQNQNTWKSDKLPISLS